MPFLALVLAAMLSAQEPPEALQDAPAQVRPSPAQELTRRGHALYFLGEAQRALDTYDQAVKKDSQTVEAWLAGGVVLEELGKPGKAVRWYARAAALSGDGRVLSSLGWAQWRAGELVAAATSFQKAVFREPGDWEAWLGAGRVALDQGRPKESLPFFEKASAAAPLSSLPPFYEAAAREKMGDLPGSSEALKRAVIADSYFLEGRDALGRAYMRLRQYDDAHRQFSRVLAADPSNKRVRGLLQRVMGLLRPRAGTPRPTGLHRPMPYLPESGTGGGKIPSIRVGVGTTPLGHPRARRSLVFRVTGPFDIVDDSGKRLAEGGADELWRADLKRVKKRAMISLTDPAGRGVVLSARPVQIRPRSPAEAVIATDQAAQGGGASGRLMRGRLELAVHKGNLRLVNVLDLENYTHGVVSAEMPIRSPLEALKAQAVLARSHALFIKRQAPHRHRKDGYDVCDDQHCQVYRGAGAESERSRQVVSETRGKIASYQGKVAHVIYSSNCGGFTQSGRDLQGWGDVPYWEGMGDGADLGPAPRGPWELRRWLTTSPAAFCKPSQDVHGSHFRWSRVIPWNDLEAKLDRRLKTGRLLEVRPVRRSRAGHVNTLLIRGSRRQAKVSSEMQVRGLLGIGSLRSTFFVTSTEYAPNGRPTALVIHGGGWGHSVGMCQSGAMGRAQAGQDFSEIIRAYFKGIEVSSLDY